MPRYMAADDLLSSAPGDPVADDDGPLVRDIPLPELHPARFLMGVQVWQPETESLLQRAEAALGSYEATRNSRVVIEAAAEIVDEIAATWGRTPDWEHLVAEQDEDYYYHVAEDEVGWKLHRTRWFDGQWQTGPVAYTCYGSAIQFLQCVAGFIHWLEQALLRDLAATLAEQRGQVCRAI